MAQCEQLPVMRYTWPGKDEAFACIKHAQQLQGLARVMGFHLQFIPLSGEQQTKVSCSQKLKGEER